MLLQMSLFVLTDSLVPTQHYKEHKFSAGGLYAHSANSLINIITPKEWSYLTEILKEKKSFELFGQHCIAFKNTHSGLVLFPMAQKARA